MHSDKTNEDDLVELLKKIKEQTDKTLDEVRRIEKILLGDNNESSEEKK